MYLGRTPKKCPKSAINDQLILDIIGLLSMVLVNCDRKLPKYIALSHFNQKQYSTPSFLMCRLVLVEFFFSTSQEHVDNSFAVDLLFRMLFAVQYSKALYIYQTQSSDILTTIFDLRVFYERKNEYNPGLLP